ncbi:hypothetical protein HanIR_Chr02g0081471 [Helianthus annuus]|nr:hypothetical protein HanIR_Chr02g0081471 [Helianthus annuus]
MDRGGWWMKPFMYIYIYVCIGICERKRIREARHTRRWVAGFDESRKRGAVWGSGAGPSRPPYLLVL